MRKVQTLAVPSGKTEWWARCLKSRGLNVPSDKPSYYIRLVLEHAVRY